MKYFFIVLFIFGIIYRIYNYKNLFDGKVLRIPLSKDIQLFVDKYLFLFVALTFLVIWNYKLATVPIIIMNIIIAITFFKIEKR